MALVLTSKKEDVCRKIEIHVKDQEEENNLATAAFFPRVDAIFWLVLSVKFNILCRLNLMDATSQVVTMAVVVFVRGEETIFHLSFRIRISILIIILQHELPSNCKQLAPNLSVKLPPSGAAATSASFDTVCFVHTPMEFENKILGILSD